MPLISKRQHPKGQTQSTKNCPFLAPLWSLRGHLTDPKHSTVGDRVAVVPADGRHQLGDHEQQQSTGREQVQLSEPALDEDPGAHRLGHYDLNGGAGEAESRQRYEHQVRNTGEAVLETTDLDYRSIQQVTIDSARRRHSIGGHDDEHL